ncbi:MAG: hypothetical protein R8P61_19265 [Bacteroidia bacterium]|nr:hypothetical protein [Bacteroidia bacterium]
MTEKEIKQLIQHSGLQTSQDFTERLMENIEVVDLEKQKDIKLQLSRPVWLILSLTVLLSFCFALFFLEIMPLFIFAMGFLMFALNRMLQLKLQYEQLKSMNY